jgi:type 1 glutamine amidotransferase
MTRNAISFVVSGAVASLFTTYSAAETSTILMVSISQGFQHPVVERKGGELSLAERIVVQLGKKHGFAVTATKDGRLINRENLAKYSATLFFTQGEIDQRGPHGDSPMRTEDREAILEYVKSGGGFVGTHCGGADTFHQWQPFLDMVGGEFIGHGPQQVSRVEVVDHSFPAVQGWPKAFSLNDEWYAYRGFHRNMRVLMMLQTEGMRDKLYDRQPYPITWCSRYGKGRVFYTGMGHREDVWTNPLYQQMIAKSLLWAAGRIEADASPNLKELFGDEKSALTRINPPR